MEEHERGFQDEGVLPRGHPDSTRPTIGTLAFDGAILTWTPGRRAVDLPHLSNALSRIPRLRLGDPPRPFAFPASSITAVDYKGKAELANPPAGYVKLLPFTYSGLSPNNYPAGFGTLTKLLTVTFADEHGRDHVLAFANRPGSYVSSLSENASDYKGLRIANELRSAADQARSHRVGETS